MNNEFDYYLIESDDNFMSPLLMSDDDVVSDATAFMREKHWGTRVAPETIIHLIFNPPFPPKPDMTDYLWLESRAVFSKKVYDVLKDIAIKDFQLVSAVIKDPQGNEYADYWIAGIYRAYGFLDPNKSKVDRIITEGRMAGRWSGIEKMVINEAEMAKVPLEERLIYVGKESSAYVYYHKSIVDAIMSVNPTGIRFVRVEDWES